MRNRNVRRPQARNISTAEFNPLTWRYFIVMAICGCVLAAGFFFAARQHFTSIEFGIKNSKLRKQLEELETENRRLVLVKEVSLSPGEIKKAARNLGFHEFEADNTVLAVVSAPQTKALPLNIVQKQAVVEVKTAGLTRTAYQRPVTPSTSEHILNVDSAAKQGKNPLPAKINRERSDITTIAKLR